MKFIEDRDPIIVPPETAQDVLQTVCERHGIELVMPYNGTVEDMRRTIVVYGLAAMNKLSGGKVAWDMDRARREVSCMIPGVGSAGLALLDLIPKVYGFDVGKYLHTIFEPVEKPMMLLSQNAVSTGLGMLSTGAEEGTHGDQIEAGTAWGYPISLVRGWSESQGGSANLAVASVLSGRAPRKLKAPMLASLVQYGLESADMAIVEDVLESAIVTVEEGGMVPGFATELLDELRSRRYSVPTF